MTNEEKANPWPTLARMVGPIMGWLAVSYMIIYAMLSIPWFRESTGMPLSEPMPIGVLVGAAVAMIAGAAITFWGFTRRGAERLPGTPPAGMITCKSCGTDLYAGTPACPYCGVLTGERLAMRPAQWNAPAQNHYPGQYYNWRR